MRRMLILLALLGSGVLLNCQHGAVYVPPTGPIDFKRLSSAGEDRGSWLSYGRTYSEERFSPLDQINRSNVSQLGLAWYHEFDTNRGQEGTPLVVDGTIFVSTSWSKVYAFDAKYGSLKWAFDPKVDRMAAFKVCCDVVNRGLAVWMGKVYVGALDGRLIALDMETGKVQWSTQTVDETQSYTITGAPRVVNGKVIIGNGGAEYGVRGYVSAYDSETGKLAWRFFTTPNPGGKPDGAASDRVLLEKAKATWHGDGWKKTGGGGTVWDSMAFDPELNILYVGVGNGSPWNHELRSDGKGDNLFLTCILALNADTGEYIWHYQTNPAETWDYTATQHMILTDLRIDGKPRKVLMQAPKNGFFYVIDRVTGELLSARNFVPVNWATGIDLKTGRPLENKAARYENGPAVVSPSAQGGHNWQPMAYNPREKLVFIPASINSAEYEKDKEYKVYPGRWNTGTNRTNRIAPKKKATPTANTGRLIAWDPMKQEARWTVEHRFPWNGGVLATAGNLVFQGNAEGSFTAYDAKTGAKVWSYEAGNGILGAPISYQIDRDQYVAILVGFGGVPMMANSNTLTGQPRLPGRLLVFKIGEKKSAPAYVLPEKRKIDLSGVASRGSVNEGLQLFNRNCRSCHGASASGTYLPDLRTSALLLNEASWKAVVYEGALQENGMIGFKKFLTPKEVEAVRAFVIEEAKLAVQN